MGINHYFSKDQNKRASFIFNFIAPLYGRIAKNVAKKYDRIINIVDAEINIEGKTVLDLGTGTGSWATKFFEKKAEKVVGIDFAEKMIANAKKVFPEIVFFQCNGEKLEKIADKSFDIVTASYVLHGVKKDKRKLILQQMKRVSRKYVVFNDFAGKVSLPVKLLEFVERSDMPYFKSHFEDELKQFFSKVKLIEVRKGGGIYIAEI